MPKVSVIIPCYNQASFLPDAVHSVSVQTMADLECILVNDGSPDNTREVALGLASADPRIRYIEQENRGLSGARNAGLAAAAGDYIQFLDADDILLPEKLADQLSALTGCRLPAVAYCDYYSYDMGDEIGTSGWYLPPVLSAIDPIGDLITRWETLLTIPPHAFLFDASIFRGHGIRFDEELPNHEDWDCYVQILRLKPDLHFVDKKLVAYRHHPHAMTTNHRKMRAGFLQAVDKQRALFCDDAHVLQMLANKRRSIKAAYSIHLPPKSIWRAFRRWAKRRYFSLTRTYSDSL